MRGFGLSLRHTPALAAGCPRHAPLAPWTARGLGRVGIGAAKWIVRVLRSPECSVVLMLTAALYVGMLAIWGTASPLEVVQNISRLFPFKALYVLLLFNLVLCMARRLPVTLGRCRPARLPAAPDDLARYPDQAMVVGREGPLGPAGLARAFRRRGYRVRLSADGRSFAALRGRFAPLGDLAFHLAFILILIGVLVSASSRFSGDVVLTEGQAFWGERGDYLRFQPREEFSRRAPRLSFAVEEIGAAFYRDELFFTELYARVRYPADSPAGQATVRLSHPLWLGGAMVNLVGYGFAPIFVLRGPDGRELDSATVNLNVFPPGTEDSFRLPGLPHRVYVTVFPDPIVTEGVPRSRSNNLRSPVLRVRVYRHKVRVYEGVIPLGSSVSFDGLRLEFPGLRLSGQARVVKDPGVSWIFAAFLLAVGGLALRLLWHRREVAGLAAVQGGATALHLGADADLFRHLHWAQVQGLWKRGGGTWV